MDGFSRSKTCGRIWSVTSRQQILLHKALKDFWFEIWFLKYEEENWLFRILIIFLYLKSISKTQTVPAEKLGNKEWKQYACEKCVWTKRRSKALKLDKSLKLWYPFPLLWGSFEALNFLMYLILKHMGEDLFLLLKIWRVLRIMALSCDDVVCGWELSKLILLQHQSLFEAVVQAFST